MPDYRITIYMRTGPPKIGVRWHVSYDGDYIRKIVEEKVKKTIGMPAIIWIDIEIVNHFSGAKIDTKPLD